MPEVPNRAVIRSAGLRSGSNREAFHAGKKPKITPTATETATAARTAVSEGSVGQRMTERTPIDAARPTRIPIAPPHRHSATASARNCRRM